MESLFNVRAEIARKAQELSAWYVICFWRSPLDGKVEHRSGYFESSIEAKIFASMLERTYSEKKLPFCIDSNIEGLRMNKGLV